MKKICFFTATRAECGLLRSFMTAVRDDPAMGERAPAEVMGEIIEVLDGLDATKWVRNYEFQVPFGVVRTQGAKICTIEEKPSHYFYDMPQLYQNLIDAGGKVCSASVKEYWLDIGRLTEFEQAQNEYAEHVDV